MTDAELDALQVKLARQITIKMCREAADAITALREQIIELRENIKALDNSLSEANIKRGDAEADNAALRERAEKYEAIAVAQTEAYRKAEADNAALRAERDAHHDAAACVRNDIKEMQRNLGAAERERDAAIKYLAEHLAERSILHDAKAAEFDPEATAFAAGMRRAAEVCRNGGADWAYDLIITDLERLEE